MEWFLSFVEKYQNYTAIFVGAAASVVAAVIGFLSRRPVVKQAVESSRFKTQTDAYEALLKRSGEESDAIIRRQNAHIAHLETQITVRDQQLEIKDEYETELLKQLSDARRQLIRAGLFHDPSSG